MPFNGSGKFVLAAGNPVAAGAIISETTHNSTMADIAANGLSNSITRDGQSTIISDLPLNNKKITMLADGVEATDAATVGQLQRGLASYASSIAGTNTITGIMSPTYDAYVAGKFISFIPAVTNTGAATINIDSLGPKDLYSGGSALTGGELIAGTSVMIIYNGTEFDLISGISTASGIINVPSVNVLSTDQQSTNDELGGYIAAINLAIAQIPYTTRMIGERFSLATDMAGVLPPSNAGAAKYIILAAGLTGAGQYNEGLLTSESVSGSAPTISATAVISLAGSPLNGVTVELINTSRRFIRAGSSGTKQDSDNKAHVHTVRSKVGTYSGASGVSDGQLGSSVSGSSGGVEANVFNIGADYFMRIK